MTLALCTLQQVMSPAANMDMSLALNQANATTIPKLKDDASNWVDYKSKALMGMGSRGLMSHIEGCVTKLKLYDLLDGVAVLSDGKTKVTEEQIETHEKRIEDFETKRYLACHIMVHSIPVCLAQRVKDETNPKKMWDAIVADSEGKSVSHQVALQRWLYELKCEEGADIKAHLTELIGMNQDLAAKGVTVTDDDFTALIMGSLPDSYKPLLQSVSSAAHISHRKIDPYDLVNWVNEEYES